MTTFDNKHWYFISRQFPKGQAVPFNTSMRAYGGSDYNISSAYFSPDNGTNSTNFHWQLFPVQLPANGSYVLRPRNVPGGFLNAVHSYDLTTPKCVTPAGLDCRTVATILPSVDLNAVWTFTETFDGTGSFYMTNSQNGTGYRMDLWNNGSWINMSPNITDDRQSQKIAVIAVGLVTDPSLNNISNSLLHYAGANESFPYASIAATLPSTTISPTTTLIATGTTGTSTPVPIPDHHTPIGAIVGAVVGVAAIAAIVFLWWFLRKRKARSQAAYQPASSSQNSPMAMDDLPPSYNDEPVKASMNVEVTGQPLAEAPSDGAHEMSVEAQRLRAEAPGSEAPRYELPG